MISTPTVWQKRTMPYTTHHTTKPSHEATKLSAFLCGILFVLGFAVVWTAATTPDPPYRVVHAAPCQ